MLMCPNPRNFEKYPMKFEIKIETECNAVGEFHIA